MLTIKEILAEFEANIGTGARLDMRHLAFLLAAVQCLTAEVATLKAQMASLK